MSSDTSAGASQIWLLSTALGAAVLSAYTQTLCPTVPGGDSGELIQVAIELGVPHPPGYPTWTLLAHAFSRLPWGEPAWRVNLSSAVCDAIASVLLSVAVGSWVGCAWTGLTAGGAFAFAPLVWMYAVQGEVFALNNLCNALLLYLLVRFDSQPTLWNGCLGAAAIGLALSNQHTIVFFCVPYAIWALIVGRRTMFNARSFSLLAASGLLGLSPYAYLIFASGPGAAWGSWGDQTTLDGLLTHMLRREYGTFQLANVPATTNDEFVLRLRRYATSFTTELPPFGVLLTLIGVACSVRHAAVRAPPETDVDSATHSASDKPAHETSCTSNPARSTHGLGILLPCAYAFYVCVFNYLSNLPASSEFYLQVQQRFWPQAHLLCSVWYAIGLRHAVLSVAAAPFLSSRPRLGPLLPAWCHALVMPTLTLVTVAWHASSHYVASDMSSTTVFRDFGIEILLALPDKPKVMLLTLGDEVVNAVRYAHRQLGVRPQLTVIDLNYLQFEWFVSRTSKASGYFKGVIFPGKNYGSAPGAFIMRQLLDANYAGWKIFNCGGMHASDHTWQPANNLPGGYRLWPLGMVMQVLKADATINLAKWSSKSGKLLPKLMWPNEPVVGSWEEIIAKNHYVVAYTNRPYYVLNLAYESLQVTKNAHEARERFQIAAQLFESTTSVTLNGSRTLPDYFYRNMGVAFSQLINLEPTEEVRAGCKQRAAKAFMKYLQFDSVQGEDRTSVEQGVVSLIPPPAQYSQTTQPSVQARKEGGNAAVPAGKPAKRSKKRRQP